jgi:hypothetical protein
MELRGKRDLYLAKGVDYEPGMRKNSITSKDRIDPQTTAVSLFVAILAIPPLSDLYFCMLRANNFGWLDQYSSHLEKEIRHGYTLLPLRHLSSPSMVFAHAMIS